MANYSLGTAEGKIKIGYDGQGINQANKGLDDFNKSARNAQRQFTTVAQVTATAAGAIAGGIALAVNSAIDFEKQLSAIGAVSGATADQMDALRAKALQLGADTAFSASESAQAMEELVKAGLSVEDVLNGAADATVALAAAGGIDLPQAATIASNAMNQFKLAAQDLPHVADLIAGAANASAISVSDFGQSLAQSGAVAKLVGVSFDDLAVAIALMGNAGIKGSDAGTSLKTMLQNLQPSTKKQSDLMKKLGIITQDGTNKFFDQHGKLKSLADVAGILNTSLKGMTDAQKAMALETIFGTDAIRAAAIISSEGAAGFNNMADAMGRISAEDVAAKRLDNVAGAIEQLKGSVETAAIAFGTALLPAIRFVANFLAELANKFSALDPRWQKLIAFAAVAAAAILGLIAVIAGIGAVIAGLVASVAAIKVGVIIAGIVAAIIAIAAAIKLAYDNSQAFRDLIGKVGAAGKAAFDAILSVVKPIVGFIKDEMIPNIKQVAQTLATNLAPAFKAIGDFVESRVLPAIAKLKEAFATAMPTILEIGKGILAVGRVIFDVLGKALGFIIPLLLHIVGPIFSAWVNGIALVIAGIPTAVSWIQKFIGVLKIIGEVILGAVIGPLMAIWETGKFVFEALMPVIQGFINFFIGLWNFLFPIVAAVWNAITAVISAAWAVITGLFQIAWSIIMAIWNALWAALIGPVTAAWNAISSAVSAAMSWIGNLISAGWSLIKSVFDRLFGWLVTPVMTVFNTVKDFITSKMDSTKSSVSSIWDAIVNFFNTAKARILAIINGFSEFVSTARNHFEAMKQAVIAKANELVSWVASLPGRLVSAIGNLGGMLAGAGRSLIQGFWDGMVGIWNSMVGWLESKMSTLRGLWPFSPAKWGPFSGRGWVLYSGRALMEGFALGMDQRVGLVNDAAEKALAGVAGRLPTDFSATVGAATTGVGTAAALGTAAAALPGSTSTTVNNEINLNVPLEDLRSIKDVQDLLEFIDRLRNDSRRGVEAGVS